MSSALYPSTNPSWVTPVGDIVVRRCEKPRTITIRFTLLIIANGNNVLNCFEDDCSTVDTFLPRKCAWTFGHFEAKSKKEGISVYVLGGNCDISGSVLISSFDSAILIT